MHQLRRCLTLAVAVFVPLSYAAPDFVQRWLLDDECVLVWSGGEHFRLANALNFLVLVVLAPFGEELLFRGLLLRTWSARWGERAGIVLSAAAFGALHADPVGAFVFGVVLGVVFVRTRSLWVVFAIHAVHNLLVWSLGVADLATRGGQPASLAELRESWWLGVPALLGIPLLRALWTRMPAAGNAATVAPAAPAICEPVRP